MSFPRVSVVVRCFNEERHIGRLLTGIAHQTIEAETILVDSGSTDATLSIASRYPVRIVTIQPEEFSFGRSLNRGVAQATCEQVVIASAHTYPVYDDWLEQMIAPFSDSRVGLVYGKQRGHPRTKYSERQIFAHWFPDRSNGSQTTPFCNNANSAIRRSLWEEVRYNEELTGLEDLDWAHRVLERGWVLAYAADAEVVHVHDETWRQIFTRYRREAIAFRRIFPSEHFHFLDFLRHFTGNVATDYYHAVLDGGLARNLTSIPLFRLMQFWGTYQGYRHQGPIPRGLRQTFYYPRSRERLDATSTDERRGRTIRYDATGEEVTHEELG